jgi:hypothetical protein
MFLKEETYDVKEPQQIEFNLDSIHMMRQFFPSKFNEYSENLSELYAQVLLIFCNLEICVN